MKRETVVEISPKTIVFTIALILILVFAWYIKGILIALLISVILMSGFAPLVDWLAKQGFNKTLAVAITYIVAISILGLILFAVIPPLIEQTRLFVVLLPDYINQLLDFSNSLGLSDINTERLVELASERLNDSLGNILNLLFNAFNGFLTFVTIAVFSFYLLLERERIKKNIFVFFPNLPKEETLQIAHDIEQKLGGWVRGQIMLMIIVGVLTWIGLTALRVPFALPLAVIAGLLESFAVIGPIVAAIPAIIIVVAGGYSPIVLMGVIALYTLIQQLENYFIVPQVMKGVVGLSPLVTILSLLIGASLFGIIGAAIAVPSAAAIQVVVLHLRDYINGSHKSLKN